MQAFIPTVICCVVVIAAAWYVTINEKNVKMHRLMKRFKRTPVDDCEYYNEQVKREEMQTAELN